MKKNNANTKQAQTISLSTIMPTLLSLSPEVHHCIFKEITDINDVVALRYTNKMFFDVGEQAQYHTIEIYGDIGEHGAKPKIKHLANLLNDRPDVGRYIRRLLIAGLTEDKTFLPIINLATGLKVLTIHHWPGDEKNRLPRDMTVFQHIVSNTVTAFSLFNCNIPLRLVNDILHNLPALVYLGLILDEYEADHSVSQTIQMFPPHTSLQILHLITFSEQMNEIITTMISLTAINWSAIEQLTITYRLEECDVFLSLHAYNATLVSMLSDNLIFLHLSISKNQSQESFMGYGEWILFFN